MCVGLRREKKRHGMYRPANSSNYILHLAQWLWWYVFDNPIMIRFMSTDHFRRGCKECNVLTHCFVLSPHSFKGKGGGECVELQTVYYRVFLCVSLLPPSAERGWGLSREQAQWCSLELQDLILQCFCMCVRTPPPHPPRPHPVCWWSFDEICFYSAVCSSTFIWG